MTDQHPDEDAAFREITERMTAKYPDFPSVRIVEIVEEVRAEMGTARVRDFVPVLAERHVKDRIKLERKK